MEGEKPTIIVAQLLKMPRKQIISLIIGIKMKAMHLQSGHLVCFNDTTYFMMNTLTYSSLLTSRPQTLASQHLYSEK